MFQENVSIQIFSFNEQVEKIEKKITIFTLEADDLQLENGRYDGSKLIAYSFVLHGGKH